MNPLVKFLLQALSSDASDRAIAERFGITTRDVDGLRSWPTQERDVIARWLLRD